MFSKEYEFLKPKVNELWNTGREEQKDPIDYLVFGLLKRCESSTGLTLEKEGNVEATYLAVHAIFDEIHELLRRT